MPYLIGVDGCRLGWLAVSAFLVPDSSGEDGLATGSPGPHRLGDVQARILPDLEPWLASLEEAAATMAAGARANREPFAPLAPIH